LTTEIIVLYSMQMTIDDNWNAYATGDHLAGLRLTTQSIAESGGIDNIHIAGLCMMAMHRHDEAIALLRAAITLRPMAPHIYSNAAFVTEQVGRCQDAEEFARAGLVSFPDNIDLLLLKANSLLIQTRYEEAITAYRQLLCRDQKNIQSLVNCGNAYRYTDDLAQAHYWFDRARTIDPAFRDLVVAEAALLISEGDHERAIAMLGPHENDADVQHMLAVNYLTMGDYARGFKLYRSRLNAYQRAPGDVAKSLRLFEHWRDAAGKRIAIVQEGGIGDTLLFYRYALKLAEVAQDVTLFVPTTLMRLLNHNKPANIKLHAPDNNFAAYDYVTSFFELPYLFEATLETVIDQVSFSVPESAVAARRLPASQLRRVGLCWASGPGQKYGDCDRQRSCDLQILAPFGEVPNTEFISLQLGARADQICSALPVMRVIDQSCNLLDAAAIIAQLDLVITVDTSIVHLAATMGKPVWLLSRYETDWKWRSNPWYTNVRVFNQTKRGDWSSPVAEIVAALS
jgi:tetratricopeptide (TPR) repeat protein